MSANAASRVLLNAIRLLRTEIEYAFTYGDPAGMDQIAEDLGVADKELQSLRFMLGWHTGFHGDDKANNGGRSNARSL